MRGSVISEFMICTRSDYVKLQQLHRTYHIYGHSQQPSLEQTVITQAIYFPTGGGVFFFLACGDSGRMFDNSFPAWAFFFFFLSGD